jgi:vancomycin permeability regulator SanA
MGMIYGQIYALVALPALISQAHHLQLALFIAEYINIHKIEIRQLLKPPV